MADDRTVKITLVAQTAPYTKGMTEASGATRKLGGDIDQTGDKAKGFGTKINAAKVALAGLAAAGATLAATKLAQFFGDAVRAAGDLEQSVGGVDAVFGDTADAVHEFGQNSAEAVGLSRNEFNELVTVTGALLKNKGLEDFTAKSLDLVQVGADLSATFGGTAKEAVEALNAAMRGESDPIERYGISLNETAVNAELAAKGLNGLEGAALEQAKAQARIDIVMRQSADSMGRFAEEANTLQGQQQRLAAEWEDAKASLGEALLPVMTEAVSLMREGVDAGMAIVAAFEKIPTPVLTAAAALGAIHVLGGPIGKMAGTVASTMGSAREALRYAGDAAARAGGGFSGAAEGVRTFTGVAKPGAAAMSGLRSAGKGLLGVLGGPWGIAFMGAAVIVGDFIGKQREAKRQVDALRTSLDEQTGAITDNTREVQLKNLADTGYLDKYREWGGDVRDVTLALEGDADARARLVEVTDRVAESEGAWQRSWINGKFISRKQQAESFIYLFEQQVERANEAVDAEELLRDAMSETGDATIDAAGAAADLGAGLGMVADEATPAGDAVDYLGRTTEEAADAAKAADEAHRDLLDALTGIIDAAYGAIDAEIAYEASLDALTEAVKENGETHDISTEAGRKNMSALTDLAQAARDNATAQLENGDSLSTVQGRMMDARDAFIKGAQQIGYTKDEANALADQLGLTADDVSTLRSQIGKLEGKSVTVTAVGPSAAADEVDRLKRMIDLLHDKTVTVYSRFVNQGSAASLYRAVQEDGGMWERGRQYMADGGLDEAGRYVPRQSMMGGPAYGKRYITWGEDVTNWEAYISGKAGMESRSKAIAAEAVRRLGGQVIFAADGRWSPGRMSAPSPAAAAPVTVSLDASQPLRLTQGDLDYLADRINDGALAASLRGVEKQARLERAR